MKQKQFATPKKTTLKRFLRYAVILQLLVSPLFCSGQTPKTAEAALPNEDNSKFIGLWEGIITFKAPWWFTNRIVVEIKPVNNREVSVRVESLRTANFRFSGPGITTPNSISWVELQADEGRPFFRRFIAHLTTKDGLAGKYFRERDSQEAGMLSLKRINADELKAFRRQNAKSLERLQTASRNVDFLEVPWRGVLTSALGWLNQTLGEEFKIIDEDVFPDLQYADDLASTLERRVNFFANHSGCEIPLRFVDANDSSAQIRNCLISLPKDFPNGQKKYPIVISLHGTQSSENRIHFATQPAPREFPIIYLRPITEDSWVPSSLHAMLLELQRLLPIDEDRVYLRGSSMGAFGTYSWALANPELFAAISPVSGGGDNFRAGRLKNIPIWIFHGEKDETVPIWMAQTMLTDLRASGANVKHTFYPAGTHNLRIDSAALDEWFLSHKRSREPSPPDPLENFKFDERGVVRNGLIKLPAQRFASIQTSQADSSRAVRRLYGVFNDSALPVQGQVQHQILPSLPNQTISLLLPIPNELEIKDPSLDLRIIDDPPTRASSFVIHFDDDSDREEVLIQTLLAEVKNGGGKPTGEIRKTALTRYYGVWIGGKNQSISKVDILLSAE